MGISAVDDLTTGWQDAARRGFFVGIALASTAADRASVAGSFLRNARSFDPAALAEPANAALVSWAHDVAATDGHRLLDYSA